MAVTASSKKRGPARSSDVAVVEGIGDAKAEAEIGWVIDLITAIRSLRAEMKMSMCRCHSLW